MMQSGKRYHLTELGRGDGKYSETKDGERYIVWNSAVIRKEVFHLKAELLSHSNFRLFHMTHIENLESILKTGAFSHTKQTKYTDICNPSVNFRRARCKPIHHCSLHDYVPLYFNPRNAVLYQCQQENPGKIVLIEVRREACLANQTLFAEKNAATTNPKFAYCLSDVNDFRWERIHAKNWKSGNVTNIDSKQMMMGECLIFNHIDPELFATIHTADDGSNIEIQALLQGMKHPQICTSSELFFPTAARHGYVSKSA